MIMVTNPIWDLVLSQHWWASLFSSNTDKINVLSNCQISLHSSRKIQDGVCICQRVMILINIISYRTDIIFCLIKET